RVRLHRLIEEVTDVGEGRDRFEARVHLAAGDAEHRAVQEDVLPPGELAVEPAAEFEEGGDPAVDDEFALRRLQRAGQHLQESRLACAVPADDAAGLAAPELEIDRAVGPELTVVGVPASEEELLQTILGPVVDVVALAESGRPERDIRRSDPSGSDSSGS